MDTNKIKQIHLGINSRNTLFKGFRGKVIKDIVLTYSYNDCDNLLVITFDDDTYISVGINHAEKDGIEYNYIGDAFILPQEHFISDAIGHIYKDTNTGEIKLYDYKQALIDIGLYDLSVEDILKIKEQHDKENEEREYKQYLRLKEKFENR